MQTKYTEATHNRPSGDRIIDAPFVFADLDEHIRQLKNEDAWKKNDRNGITIYKTDGFTMVLTCLHENAMIENNTVDGLLILQVLDGSVDITVEINGKGVLHKNQLMTLHPGIPHSIRAREDSTLLLSNKTASNAPENDTII